MNKNEIPTREELLATMKSINPGLPETFGESGFNSLRVGGMKIEDLPIAEQAEAKSQMALWFQTEKEHKIGLIRKNSPSQNVDWLKACIREAEANIKRVNELINRENTMISEYSGLITLCEIRDKEIARIDGNDPDKAEKIKDWNKRVPPYKVDAMKQQMIQSQESIDRANEVIAKEHETIKEVNTQMVLCEQRDVELQKLGVAI